MINRRIVLAGAAVLAFTASASAQDWKGKYPELTFAVVPAENACSHNCGPQNARFGKLMDGQKLRPVLHLRIHQEFNARKGG